MSKCVHLTNVNNRYFSTESGITLSSSSSLSINAGYVGMFAGNVSIEGATKLVAESGKVYVLKNGKII